MNFMIIYKYDMYVATLNGVEVLRDSNLAALIAQCNEISSYKQN